MNTLSVSHGTNKKILIADDDQAILEAMKMMLEMEGYSVLTAANGENIHRMIDQDPDLLFLDIWMSGVDGRDICKVIKKEKRTKNLPVIMISASPEGARSAKASGADDFIAKPFQMTELLDKAEKFLRNK